MSRSGYTDDDGDPWAMIRWRGAVNSAIKGRRGQAFLKEVLAALDAMPDKRLAAESLITAEGEFCTLGALGNARGLSRVKLAAIDPDDRSFVAKTFGVAEALAAEIMFLNDEQIDEHDWVNVEICGPMRPHYPDLGRHRKRVRVENENAASQRWAYMRTWVEKQILESETA